VVVCLKQDADLHVAQLMPLPLTVSCFTKIQIGFTFLVPGGQHSMRTYMIWHLHGWVQRGLPATDRNAESLSPDVSEELEELRSKVRKVPAYPGSLGQRAVKRVCVCVLTRVPCVVCVGAEAGCRSECGRGCSRPAAVKSSSTNLHLTHQPLTQRSSRLASFVRWCHSACRCEVRSLGQRVSRSAAFTAGTSEFSPYRRQLPCAVYGAKCALDSILIPAL